MSNVTGIGGFSGDPLQYMRQMQERDPAMRGDRAAGMQPGQSERGQQLWAKVTETAESSGLNSEQIDALRSDLKSAISSAMESVDRSAGPQAGQSAIQDAILGTLQEHGVDTQDLESRMNEAKDQMQGMMASGGGPMGSQPQGMGGMFSSFADGQDPTSSLLASLFPLVDEEA